MRRSRQVAACTMLRHSASVASRQLRTADYGEDARVRLGKAVVTARTEAGYPLRPAFAKAAGVAKRGLADLEQGKPGIGQKTLYAVARALPNWAEDTPQTILDGGPIPPTTAPVPTSETTVSGGRQVADLSHLTRAQQRARAELVLDLLPVAQDLGPELYAHYREQARKFVAKYGGDDEAPADAE